MLAILTFLRLFICLFLLTIVKHSYKGNRIKRTMSLLAKMLGNVSETSTVDSLILTNSYIYTSSFFAAVQQDSGMKLTVFNNNEKINK